MDFFYSITNATMARSVFPKLIWARPKTEVNTTRDPKPQTT